MVKRWKCDCELFNPDWSGIVVEVVPASDYDAKDAAYNQLGEAFDAKCVELRALAAQLETERADKQAWEDTANGHKRDADALAARLLECETALRHYAPDSEYFLRHQADEQVRL